MNIIQKVFKEAIENSGEVELRIRIKREDAVGEVYEKLKGLLLLFPPDRIQVVPIKELTPEEEQEIFEIAMSDYEGDGKNFAEMLIKVGDDEDF